MELSPAKKGAIAEIMAASLFMNLGLEAFINQAPAGPADLVVMDTDTYDLALIDVKVRNWFQPRKGCWAYAIGLAQKHPRVFILNHTTDYGFFWTPAQELPKWLAQLPIPQEGPEPRKYREPVQSKYTNKRYLP